MESVMFSLENVIDLFVFLARNGLHFLNRFHLESVWAMCSIMISLSTFLARSIRSRRKKQPSLQMCAFKGQGRVYP